jgi:transposase
LSSGSPSKRSGGSSGKKIGNAHLKWAFSEATTLLMSKSPEAKKFVERKSKKYGKAKAISVLAAKLGRSVYHMLRDEKPFDEGTFFAGL